MIKTFHVNWAKCERTENAKDAIRIVRTLGTCSSLSRRRRIVQQRPGTVIARPTILYDQTCPTSCVRTRFARRRVPAKNGSCVDNPSYMLTHCPRACGVCQFSCVDLHNDCPGWAMEDQCNTNAPFMVKTCPKSCRVCEDNLGCKDFNSTLCEMWGQPGCEGNPVAVLRDCPRTCGVCTNVCLDKSENCTSWMHSGECDANPIAMGKKCPQACGICHQIEALHNPFPEKDEL